MPLLQCPEAFLYTLDSHFRYNTRYSTEVCVRTLKDTTEHYTSRCSPVCLCCHHVSEVFGTVNHCKELATKLLVRGTPDNTINPFMYTSQESAVTWWLPLPCYFRQPIVFGMERSCLLIHTVSLQVMSVSQHYLVVASWAARWTRSSLAFTSSG